VLDQWAIRVDESVTRSNRTAVLPWVRGIWSLISAIRRGAESAAALAASTDVPAYRARAGPGRQL